MITRCASVWKEQESEKKRMLISKKLTHEQITTNTVQNCIMMTVTDHLRMIGSSQTDEQSSSFWLSIVTPKPMIDAFLYAYHWIITRPLRYFYFVGPVWKNMPFEEICNQMTQGKLGADHFRVNMDICVDMLERNFVSWDVGLITSLYFAVLGFIVVYSSYNCCFIPSTLRKLRKLHKRLLKEKERRKHRRSEDQDEDSVDDNDDAEERR